MADDGPDMENRDPNDLNSHVKVMFEDVIGEPEGVRSIDCVWRCSYKCFNGTLSCCYKCLTVVCAIPLAFCWGISFACLAFQHIWQCTPYIKYCVINMMCVRKLVVACLEGFCAPICETCGLFFSKIAVQNK